jgi:hypothetical protein
MENSVFQQLIFCFRNAAEENFVCQISGSDKANILNLSFQIFKIKKVLTYQI